MKNIWIQIFLVLIGIMLSVAGYLGVKKYLVPRRKIILDIYYSLPSFIKKIMKKIIKKDNLKKMW